MPRRAHLDKEPVGFAELAFLYFGLAQQLCAPRLDLVEGRCEDPCTRRFEELLRAREGLGELLGAWAFGLQQDTRQCYTRLPTRDLEVGTRSRERLAGGCKRQIQSPAGTVVLGNYQTELAN